MPSSKMRPKAEWTEYTESYSTQVYLTAMQEVLNLVDESEKVEEIMLLRAVAKRIVQYKNDCADKTTELELFFTSLEKSTLKYTQINCCNYGVTIFLDDVEVRRTKHTVDFVSRKGTAYVHYNCIDTLTPKVSDDGTITGIEIVTY